MPRGWRPFVPVRFVGRGGPEHGLTLLSSKCVPGMSAHPALLASWRVHCAAHVLTIALVSCTGALRLPQAPKRRVLMPTISYAAYTVADLSIYHLYCAA